MARALPDNGYKELGSAGVPALAFLELSSISRGLFLTDAVVKKAPVRIITSQPVSSGKHVLLFMGDNASVEESHREAVAKADGTLLREVLIPGVHEQLAPFLDSIWSSDPSRGFGAPAQAARQLLPHGHDRSSAGRGAFVFLGG